MVYRVYQYIVESNIWSMVSRIYSYLSGGRDNMSAECNASAGSSRKSMVYSVYAYLVV